MQSFIFQCLLRLSQWVHRILLPVQRYALLHTPLATSIHDELYLHNCDSHRSVDCSSVECENGGTCVTSFWSSPRCDCPSGYIGSHCQYKGMYMYMYTYVYANPEACTYIVYSIFSIVILTVHTYVHNCRL